jgi:tetratricopeptide (TPR) repeat protein
MKKADLFFRFCLLGPELWGLLLSVPIQSQVAGKPHQAESQAVSHFNHAEKLADAQQYLQAISEYKLALQETPNDESALFGLAIAQAKAGQNPDAIQSYLTVLKVNPKLWEAEVNLGILLLSQQSTSEALTHFQNAQTLNPKNFRVHYYTSKTQELLGDIAHAETSYLQALDLAQEDSDRFEINASLGSLYLRKKSWTEAERHLLAARQLPGHTVTVDLDLAQLYYETGQPQKALDLLKSANKSDDPEIHELMGRILIATKDNDQAIQSFELALKNQKDPERRRNLSLDLAQLYQQQGRTQDAISLVDTIAKSSDDPRIHFTLGTLHLHDRQFEPARQEFLRALQLKPDYVECYSNLGSVFLLEEKYPAAVEALGRFKALRPQVAGTYFYLGIAYDKLDDYPNAWAHYQKFLDLDQGKTDKQGFQARERMKELEKKIKKR